MTAGGSLAVLQAQSASGEGEWITPILSCFQLPLSSFSEVRSVA